ncbi:MAG: hypothetical protein AMJ84_11410 [Acidithiobacillales bacterium SM23_46]|nr:MAG: hypothetical protein AMJ84_11410 [Acidithiobacillales bacterium SM23_46]
MIGNLLMSIGIIVVALGGWLTVQAAARRLAARRPEFGPAREECAGGCADHGCTRNETTCKREADS